MKKLLTWIFVLTFVLGLLVYQAVMLSMPKEEPRHISDMLVERSWSLYLILPISQEEADVFCSRDVLEQIDLRTAAAVVQNVKKITED